MIEVLIALVVGAALGYVGCDHRWKKKRLPREITNYIDRLDARLADLQAQGSDMTHGELKRTMRDV